MPLRINPLSVAARAPLSASRGSRARFAQSDAHRSPSPLPSASHLCAVSALQLSKVTAFGRELSTPNGDHDVDVGIAAASADEWDLLAAPGSAIADGDAVIADEALLRSLRCARYHLPGRGEGGSAKWAGVAGVGGWGGCVCGIGGCGDPTALPSHMQLEA